MRTICLDPLLAAPVQYHPLLMTTKLVVESSARGGGLQTPIQSSFILDVFRGVINQYKASN